MISVVYHVTTLIKKPKSVEHLKDIEKMGVEIILCATCVNYYSLESLIGVGIVSNMYTIAELLASAGNIVRP